MADVSADEKADILKAEAEKLDNLLRKGDPDAALSVIGGIASALNSDPGDSDSGSQQVYMGLIGKLRSKPLPGYI